MGKVMVTTVPGTVDGKGNRTVAYCHVDDRGRREVRTVAVTGDRSRVRAQLSWLTGEDNVVFDRYYERM